MIPQPTEITWIFYSLDLFLSQRPAVSILKEQGRGGGTQRLGAGNQCLYRPFGPVVTYMILQPTEIRWCLSGTSPSLGARRLYSLDLFLSQFQRKSQALFKVDIIQQKQTDDV